jgi:folylpolyglutamate synthase/dihydrofolate synthase
LGEILIANYFITKMSYQETLQYLYDRLPVFHHVGSSAYKPGLDNTIRLMDSLNNPQKKFRSIHVAGTNGKGSISHFLAAVLQSAGYKVGLYTSPHLVHFGERIRIDGKMIEEQYVIDFVEHNKELFESVQPSFFEATMAIAFNYFADSKVDVAIIEVGLGGRLDSTNIIQPDLSVITNISFDHTGFLGDTLEKIASEKAGIIKQDTPVVIGEVLPETRLIFEKKAIEMNAPLAYAEDQYNVLFAGYESAKMKVNVSDGRSFVVGLSGLYQLKNIATLLTAADKINQIGFKLSEQNISDGLKHVTELTGLQGRWQMLQENPKIVVDTGHNVAGIGCVIDQLNSEIFKTLHIVIGMVNDKDITSVLSLLPKDAVYYFTQANIFRALPAAELQAQAQMHGLNGDAYKTVEQAINAAVSKAEKQDFILIGGSNFIVGEALPMFEKSVADKLV